MWINLTLLALAGALGWSLTEYLMHRFIGHRKGSKRRFAKEHTAHHAKAGYFTSAKTKCLMAIRILLPLWVLLALTVGIVHSTALTGGFALAYLGYECMHYSFHAYAPKTPWGRWLRKHHFAHHYHNPSHNHGVTSPIWDVVFGTHRPAAQILVPRKLAQKAIPWLIHPETGEIQDAFKGDYAFKERKRRA